jgi:hypothetical protein
MTRDEWQQWKFDSMDTFNKYYSLLNVDIEQNGTLTKKRALTSLLYSLNRCNYEAGDDIVKILEDDANKDKALANYIMGHIFMYGYRGLRFKRDFIIAREYFSHAHELNSFFENKQNP